MKAKPNCKHDWFFEHTIYQGRSVSKNSAAIHRQCSKCGKHEMAFVSKWVAKPRGYSVVELTTKGGA